MTQSDLGRIPDGGTLRQLANGLEIIRRMKHEWRNDLAGMPADKLQLRTGKKAGSKFFPAWTLLRLTDEIERQVALAGWGRSVPPVPPVDVRYEQAVGLADGIAVHTIRFVCDGHYIHAYPMKD